MVDENMKVDMDNALLISRLNSAPSLMVVQTDRVSAEHKSLEEIRSQLQLVLLDFGLAEELTPRVRKHFISFLHMISSGNGRQAAYHMLLFSTKQECPRPQLFADDMEKLFGVEAQIDAPDGIDVDKVGSR